jgi:hypothetical protein
MRPFEIFLDFLGGGHLVGCFFPLESLFELPLPRCIGVESVAGDGSARRIEPH